jgi:hypothetical protein
VCLARVRGIILEREKGTQWADELIARNGIELKS